MCHCLNASNGFHLLLNFYGVTANNANQTVLTQVEEAPLNFQELKLVEFSPRENMSPNPSSARPAPETVAVHAALIAVRQAAQLLCDRGSLLVLLHAHGGVVRYAEFSGQTGLPSRLLSSRLAQLTEDGLLVRIPYSRRPLRHAYHLTHMGAALFDVLGLLVTWEQTWPDSLGANTVVRVVHIGCQGAQGGNSAMATVRMHCRACGERVHAREISLRVSQTEMAKMPAKSTATRRSSHDVSVRSGDLNAVLPQALAVLGDKWSIEVLVCAFFGVRQFGDFGARIGISTNILSDRLTRLVNAGLMRRSAEDEPHRKGLYLLTPKGQDFYAILIAIQSWADAWIDHRIRSPVKLRHIPCQKALDPQLKCVTCGHPLAHAEARIIVRTSPETTARAIATP